MEAHAYLDDEGYVVLKMTPRQAVVTELLLGFTDGTGDDVDEEADAASKEVFLALDRVVSADRELDRYWAQLYESVGGADFPLVRFRKKEEA